MKQIIFFAITMIGFCCTTNLQAQTQPTGMVKKKVAVAALEMQSFAVLGNCGMCKKTIEKAAIGANAVNALWDEKTTQIKVTFDPAKTSVDAIQKAIAKAGYDNAGYKADQATYDNLHGCCKYDRTGAAGGTKSCSEGN
jgi:periplasmic mercuric ion binding protein